MDGLFSNGRTGQSAKERRVWNRDEKRGRESRLAREAAELEKKKLFYEIFYSVSQFQ